jgi:ribosomal protein S13
MERKNGGKMEKLLNEIREHKVVAETDNNFLKKFTSRAPKIKYKTIESTTLTNILSKSLKERLNSKKKVLVVLDEIIEKIKYKNCDNLNISISGEKKQIDDNLFKVILKYVDKRLFSNQTFLIEIVEKLKTVEDIYSYSVCNHKNGLNSIGQKYEKNISVKKMEIIFDKMDDTLWDNLKFINKLAKSCEKTLVYEKISNETETLKKSNDSKVYVQKEIFELFLKQNEQIRHNRNFINKFCENAENRINYY